MLKVFITGCTGEDGKTLIGAGLALTMQSLGYSTCVYKPIQTGAIPRSVFMQSPDLAYVSALDPYIKTASTYLFKEKTIPLIASEIAKTPIDIKLIKNDYEELKIENECIITEGTDGILTPIAQNFLATDLIKLLKQPVLFVVKPDINTVNSVLLSLNKAKDEKINIRGVILNNYSETTTNKAIKSIPRLIEEYSDAKVLGIVKHFKNVKEIKPNELITNILNGIDIESVFNVKIAKLDF